MDRDTPSYLVLGPVMVLDERGDAIDLGGAQRRAVLAQLALSPGRTVAVSAISQGLWADDPPPTATKAIQVHVSKLRRLLPDGALVTRPPGYALAVGTAAVDLGLFTAEARRGSQELAAGRPDRAADLLRSALGRWRGPALADVADLPFAAAQVVHLDEAREHALDDRIDADLALGRHAELVGEVERLLHDDPLHERRWAQLMVALYRCGRQGDALDAYARARRMLLERLGLDPSPALQALERQVLDQAVPPPASPATTPPATRRRPAPLALRPTGPVVGRQDALAGLDAALDAASAGRGSLVVVQGEEGLGKTTLVAAFAERIADRALVLGGRCREHVALPFAPWAEVLHQLGADDALDLLEGSGSVEDDAPERRRAEVLQAVVDALHQAALDQPLVVALDDLQWSDDASVVLLQHAVDQLAGAPVLFVAAWRGREVGFGHPVARLEHQALRGGARTIELAPLHPSHIADLLARTTLRGDSARLRQVSSLIHRVTSGVPLFVHDVVVTLEAGHGELPSPEDLAPVIPETARTLVAGRLAGAGADAAVVVEACAVLTDPFDPTVVQDLLPEVDAPRVLAGLDALVDAGLLDEGPVGHGFAHAAYRGAVDAELRSGRRQSLHAAAFRSLERRSVPPSVVAHHGERAGVLVPRSDVLRHLERAGHDAVARGAFADAAQLFGRAVDCSTPGAGTRAPLLVAHADALWRAGDISAAKAVAAEVLAMAGDPGLDDDVLADAVVTHSWFGTGFGVDPSSLAAAGAAAEVLTDPEARARALVAAAFHHATWGSPLPEALAAVEAATRALPEPCAPALAADALLAESQALLGTPELARRERLADALLDLGRARGSLHDVGRALRMRSLVEMSAGRLRALDATLEELLEVADRLGSWLYRADAWRWRTAAALATGDDAAAVAALDELDRVAASPMAGRAFVGTQRVLQLWSRGDLDACLTLLDGLRSALPDDATVAPDRRVVDLFRLIVLTDAGRTDEAHDAFLQLDPVADLDLAPSRHRPAVLAYTATLVSRFGLRELAPPLIERLEPFRGQLLVLSWGESILGAADRRLGALSSLLAGAADVRSFHDAVDLEEESGAVVEAARSRAALDRAREHESAPRPR